jgi:putative transposase
MVSPEAKRAAVRHVALRGVCSERFACRTLGAIRSTIRRARSASSSEKALRQKILELAEHHPSYGFRRVWALLKREGMLVNLKRVHRLWKLDHLQRPRRRPKRKAPGPTRQDVLRAEGRNDFIEDRTERGNKLRILSVLDEGSRECLALRCERSFPSEKVIDTLEWLFLVYGAPCHIRSDNGPEFIAKSVRDWLEAKHTETVYIEPGCPWENPFVESFHGSLRMECLNRHLFFSGAEAQAILDDWREDYNEFRPHSSLGWQTPAHAAARMSLFGRAAPSLPETSIVLLSEVHT